MSGAAAALKTALAVNRLTLEQLLQLPEREALRLPMVGPKVWAEAKRRVSKRGGRRPGAGRKSDDGATSLVQIAFRATPEQRDKLARLALMSNASYSSWIRRAIDAAPE